MTGRLAMQPSEPPSRDVQEVLELLRVARVEVGHARGRLRRVGVWIKDPMLDVTERMKLQVMRSTLERSVELWGVQVMALEDRVRSFGLRP